MNRAVAFIDILGFKQMIGNQSAAELGEKKAIGHALEKYSINADFSKEPAIFPGMSVQEFSIQRSTNNDFRG